MVSIVSLFSYAKYIQPHITKRIPVNNLFSWAFLSLLRKGNLDCYTYYDEPIALSHNSPKKIPKQPFLHYFLPLKASK